jgi:pimeloyl-ACP methyl ester carboxylesterase
VGHGLLSCAGVRPSLLLVPGFTEVEWTIRPLLERWATVHSFDPPGVGDEPWPGKLTRKLVVGKGVAALDATGADRVFVVADGWAIATAAHIARERPAAVAGMALGHARLSHRRDGERAPVNAGVFAAMSQLIESDAPAFVRYGIAQVTGGSFDDAQAERMLERVPTEHMAEGWSALTADEPFGEVLAELECPLLLAKHEGCLMSTDEGFADAVSRLPSAQTVAVPDAPASSPEFADALRDFCLRFQRGA